MSYLKKDLDLGVGEFWFDKMKIRKRRKKMMAATNEGNEDNEDVAPLVVNNN
jgi:hypothetical protein